MKERHFLRVHRVFLAIFGGSISVIPQPRTAGTPARQIVEVVAGVGRGFSKILHVVWASRDNSRRSHATLVIEPYLPSIYAQIPYRLDHAATTDSSTLRMRRTVSLHLVPLISTTLLHAEDPCVNTSSWTAVDDYTQRHRRSRAV